MIFIYMLLTAGTGIGLWIVGSLLLVGHLFEALCVSVIVVATGYCGLLFARRTPLRVALPFVGFCLANSLEIAAHMAFGLPPDPLWAWLNIGALLAGGPLFLDFVTQFPVRRPNLRWLVVLACAVSLFIGITGAMGWYGKAFNPMDPAAIEGRMHHFMGVGPMYGSGASRVIIIMVAVGLLVLWGTRRDAIRRQDHRSAGQALVVALSVVVGWSQTLVFVLKMVPLELQYWFHAPPAVFMAAMPLAGALAVTHPDFYDQRGRARRWLIDVGWVAGAYLLYLAVVRPLTFLLGLVQPGVGSEVADFGAALVVAVMVHPINHWVTERVDQLFFPHLVGFRTRLLEASQALATTIIPGDVAKLATERLPVLLGVSGAVLLVLDDLEGSLVSQAGPPLVVPKGHPLWFLAHRATAPTLFPHEAECAELGLNAPGLVLPLRVGGRFLGVYVLGARQPGVAYTRGELGQLMVLAHHLAVSVENGRALRKIDELSQRALAEVEERNQIAREMHDTIAQGLAAASLQLEVLGATLTENPAKAAKAAERAQGIVREKLAEARRSVLELRAPLLGTESLPAALSRLLNQAAAEIGAAGSFHLDGTYMGLPARIENQCYRIAQEALQNAVKYSSARHLAVTLLVQEHAVALTIADDGAGFDASAPRGDGRGGFGLNGMGERARLLGGELRVISDPGHGTVAQVSVPLHTNAVEAS